MCATDYVPFCFLLSLLISLECFIEGFLKHLSKEGISIQVVEALLKDNVYLRKSTISDSLILMVFNSARKSI